MDEARKSRELEHSRAVREMFAGIAGRYDLLNHLLSLNIDKRWRRQVSRVLAEKLCDSRAVVLDVACGTGDLAIELANSGPARVIGTDFCRPMLEIAAKKTTEGGHNIPYVEADALSLSFPDNTFDAVSIAFGLRNLANVANGLSELRRVLKPDGILAVLECSAPIIPGFRTVFDFYFGKILPRIGGVLSGSRSAYEYLPSSVARFPKQKALADMMIAAGFRDVDYRNLTGGIVALHTGRK
jgi:demethylmenaquinone methyltransferase/2-methoxy-6-polyprenyl-1,4-benzoquinol methylase